MVDDKSDCMSKIQLDFINSLLAQKSYFDYELRYNNPGRVSDIAHIVDSGDISKLQASSFIDELLSLQEVKFNLLCGIKKWVSLEYVKEYHLFGDIEACMEYCPYSLDVNDCIYYKEEDL